jgi:hypothetical protein
MSVGARRGRRGAVVLVIMALFAGACASGPVTTPSGGNLAHPTVAPTPGPSGSAGPAWGRAAIEQPPGLGVPAPSPSGETFCSPCHSTDQTRLAAVAGTASGLVSVGWAYPGLRAAAWTSSDGLTWSRVPDFPQRGVSAQLTAVAAGEGRLVAVGTDADRAAVWISLDGRAWTEAAPLDTSSGPPTHLLAVASLGQGFVVGGYRERPTGGGDAVAWYSPDGTQWLPAPLPRAEGATLAGLASGEGRVVAVGWTGLGSGQRAAAWTSPDGLHWAAGQVAAGGASRLDAVTSADGTWVAVGAGGANGSGDDAAAWTSVDGGDWAAVPDGPVFQNYTLPIEMLAVATTPQGLVAVGEKHDAGNGSGVVWLSADGRSWSRLPAAADFSGGGMAGVTEQGGRVVVVGSLGWPDEATATIWLSPPPSHP